MNDDRERLCTAFEGCRRIESGELTRVALKTKGVVDGGDHTPVIIFDDATGEPIEVDFRGTHEDVLGRLEARTNRGESDQPEEETRRRVGRPKLGVVAREVTLLPRHWDWLNSQPGGASVALRKLVEQARHVNAGRDRVRQSQEAAYRFMSILAGNQPGFEEATRALFAANPDRFDVLVEPWPADVRNHARKLAAIALHPEAAQSGQTDDSDRTTAP
jgi:uncharacterized protein